MSGTPERGSIAWQRAVTIAMCSVIFAAVGGVLLATPANAGVMDGSDICVTPTSLIDAGGPGEGAVTLDTTAAGITPGVDCVTSAPLGDPAPSDSSTPAEPYSRTKLAATGSTNSTNDNAPTTNPAPVVNAPTETSGSTISAAGASTSTSTSTVLAHMSVLRSSNTVYPIRDGYRDSVRFAVRAMNASGGLIPVVGSAMLTKSGKAVATWHIDNATTVITWNGRVKHAIISGLYRLTVSAWSPDGSEQSVSTLVRVLTKHIVVHTMTVRSNVGAKSVAADMPRKLLKAYSTGEITVRVVTVATVSGQAKLVYSNNGVIRSIVLKNGTHTTKALLVPQGFSHVTITHDWAKGAAHLKMLAAIWTYTVLS